MPIIYIDADACPVKDEIYRVARRYQMKVMVVAKVALHVPADALIELVVRPGFGEVDDRIAELAGPGDIVVTQDIPLAARCLARQARVLDPRGQAFTESRIGEALALRDLLDALRQGGAVMGGPAPKSAKDRSRFLSKLDETVNAVRRAFPKPSETQDRTMADPLTLELLSLNRKLLESIVRADWQTYQELCDPGLTCFEPEAGGHLVAGLPFHEFYFKLGGASGHHETTMSSPHVRVMGDVAVLSYVRLNQRQGPDGAAVTVCVAETRVWQRQEGRWRHVHFHRSPA